MSSKRLPICKALSYCLISMQLGMHFDGDFSCTVIKKLRGFNYSAPLMLIDILYFVDGCLKGS